MRKSVIVVAAIGSLVLVAGAGAASRFIITSTHQIKPSVLRQLHGTRGATGARGSAGVVPGIVTVDSPKETLQPGQSTFEVDPNNFQATCPSGYSVLGTGFNAGIGRADFVIAYGTFVGGFIDNDTNVPFDVYLQAVCGQVAGGSFGANAVHGPSAQARYQADLRAMR